MGLLKKITVVAVIAVFFTPSTALGLVNPQSRSATVTATMPNIIPPDTPVLISPANNSTISTTAPTFIFNPSSGETLVSHYQLWIDGVKNTDNIPQSYSTITVNALAALSQGLHTWMVKAIGTNSTERDSSIWTFTIDTTAPLILVSEVAGQATNLSSLDLSPWQNLVSFTTSDRYPLIRGQSEAQSFVTISFTGQTTTDTISITVGADGLFGLKPNIALPLGRYSVSVSSSDPAGNNTSLPSFYVEIVSGAALVKITLPPPLPNLSFTVPVIVPPSLAPVTAFPLIPTAPAQLNYLVWLIIVTYLCHIYCLNRFISRLYLHHSIKDIHLLFIYITILLPSLLLAWLAAITGHWLALVLTLLSFACLIYEAKLIRSKHIKIEQF